MGRIRIIAGELKGRRIRVPEGPALRPTADRVREALFSILGARISHARVLDAYAGSGALGFEAISRGAREVVFLEADRSVARHLERAAADLDVAERCSVHPTDAARWLAGGGGRTPFNVILADPPYGAGAPEALLSLASNPAWLAPRGWIVVERAATADPVEDAGHGVRRFRTARYGGTCLDFFAAGCFERSGAASGPPG
jgi:16S rRNA (guanine966-N2)-methyltransferase